MILKFIDFIGKITLRFLTLLGDFATFLFVAIKTMLSTKLKVKQLFIQMENIGVGGFPIVVLTGFGTGLVLALQTYIGFKKFGTEDFIASTIILPFLTIFSVGFGILGGYIYCVYQLDINPEDYMSGIRQYLEMSDVINGLIKSCFFGLILAWVGTYCGYKTTKGGARAVGISTTQSVVLGSVLILIADYFLSAILFNTGVS